MSAIEYLLTSHMPAADIRRLALVAGVSTQRVEDNYGLDRVQAWVAEYVQRVGVEAAWNDTKQFLQWGRNALYDFPVEEEVTQRGLKNALRTLEQARGDVFAGQATRDLQADPQVALIRQIDRRSHVVVADEGTHEFRPKLTVGLDAQLVPRWTMCALTRRAGSWRLEVYSDTGQAHRLAEAVAAQLRLSFTLRAPHNVTLSMREIERLADELSGRIRTRKVVTHQETTGLRKLEGEAGSAVEDIRDSDFYKDKMRPVTDELDFDIVEIPWHGQDYSLRVSRHGSFWFRAFTPRELVDAVLERAERMRGI